jgi:hypothetical protein
MGMAVAPARRLNVAFTFSPENRAMLRSRTPACRRAEPMSLDEVEADLLALRSAAQRSAAALTHLFLAPDAAEVVVRRSDQQIRRSRRHGALWSALGKVVLALAFLLL